MRIELDELITLEELIALDDKRDELTALDELRIKLELLQTNPP